MSGSTQRSAPSDVTCAVLPPSDSAVWSLTESSVTRIKQREEESGMPAEVDETLLNPSALGIGPNWMQPGPSTVTCAMHRL